MKIYTKALLAIVLREFNERRTYKTQMLLTAISTVVGLVQFGILGLFLSGANDLPGMERYGGNVVGFMIVGSMFSGLLLLAMSSLKSSIQEEQVKGTLELIASSRVGVIGHAVLSAVFSLSSSLVMSLAICYLFAYVFSFNIEGSILAIFAVALLGLVAMGAIGLLAAGYILVSKKGEPFTWAFGLLSGLFSGVLYPVQIFPHWLQGFAYALPATGTLDAIRLIALEGHGLFDVINLLWSPVVFAVVGVPLGVFALRRGLWKARKEGSIGEY